MPPLTAEDVQTFGKSKVESEMRERLEDVASIREKFNGSLANVKGDDAERVRQHMADLNLLGERKEAVLELENADRQAQDLQHSLDEPGGKMRHPGPGDPKGTGQNGDVDMRDAGLIFSESDALKAYRHEGIKGVEADVPLGSLIPSARALDIKGYRPAGVKDTLGETPAVPTQYPPQSVRVGVLVEELFQQPNISDLIPQATINQPAVPYMREEVNSTAAVETAEAALAPEASLSFTEDSAPVRKITVQLPVTEEILEDEALVRGHVNNRLPQFIAMREDSQLILGDGTGQNLTGVLNTSGVDASTAYSIAADTTATSPGLLALESVFHGIMRVAESFLQADAAVMNLAVWERIRLSKDKNNQYLIAAATESATPRVWGLRIVTNQNMPAEAAGNKPILVGAFGTASQIWRRRAITLAVSDSHVDNFARGILVIKATSRLAITHYRPAGYAVVISNA